MTETFGVDQFCGRDTAFEVWLGPRPLWQCYRSDKGSAVVTGSNTM